LRATAHPVAAEGRAAVPEKEVVAEKAPIITLLP